MFLKKQNEQRLSLFITLRITLSKLASASCTMMEGESYKGNEKRKLRKDALIRTTINPASIMFFQVPYHLPLFSQP